MYCFLCYHSRNCVYLVMTGYIDAIKPLNNYFDVSIRSSPFETMKLRVMDESKMESFAQLKENKSPVKCANVSPAKGLSFFNKSSTLTSPKKLKFEYGECREMTVSKLTENMPQGTFTISGEIVWMEPSRIVTLKAKREQSDRNVEKQVRDARLIDKNKDSIDLSIWGQDLISKLKHGVTYRFTRVSASMWKNNVKLGTTVLTEVFVADKQLNVGAEKYNGEICKLCCPEIEFATPHSYISCLNRFCKKKLPDGDHQGIVKCQACYASMKKSKCPTTYSVEVTLLSKGNQFTLTVFPNILQNFFGNEDVDTMVNELL